MYGRFTNRPTPYLYGRFVNRPTPHLYGRFVNRPLSYCLPLQHIDQRINRKRLT